MEDLQTNILVAIGYCCVGNLCANTKPHGFVVCSCRLQAHNNPDAAGLLGHGAQHSSQLVQQSASARQQVAS